MRRPFLPNLLWTIVFEGRGDPEPRDWRSERLPVLSVSPDWGKEIDIGMAIDKGCSQSCPNMFEGNQLQLEQLLLVSGRRTEEELKISPLRARSLFWQGLGSDL